MKTKQEIVENWLPRYTHKKLEEFGEYVLLTNFNNYVDIFCQKFSARVLWKYLVYTKDYAKDSDIICLPVYMTPFI